MESIRNIIQHQRMKNVLFFFPLTSLQPLQADDMAVFFWHIISALEPQITMNSYRRKVLSFNCMYLVTQTEAMACEGQLASDSFQLLDQLQKAFTNCTDLFMAIAGGKKANKTKTIHLTWSLQNKVGLPLNAPRDRDAISTTR